MHFFIRVLRLKLPGEMFFPQENSFVSNVKVLGVASSLNAKKRIYSSHSNDLSKYLGRLPGFRKSLEKKTESLKSILMSSENFYNNFLFNFSRQKLSWKWLQFAKIIKTSVLKENLDAGSYLKFGETSLVERFSKVVDG